MKCTNCGAELTGKFCTNCGTPAPAEETTSVFPESTIPAPEAMPVQNETAPVQPESVPFSQDSVQPQAGNPYADVQQPYQSEPVSGEFPAQGFDSNAYQSTQFAQNVSGSTNPFEQQSTYPTNNGYTGQQFTNAQATAPNGKKPMSGGKIAIIVISIIVGVLLILGIIVGVIIWNVYNSVTEDIVDDYSSYLSEFNSEFSSALDEYSSEISDYEFSYDSSSETSSESSYVYDGDLDEYYHNTEEVFNYETGYYYIPDPEDSSKAIITGSNMYTLERDIVNNQLTLTVPETIDGLKVEEIYDMYVYNPVSEDIYIKVIVPGHIKTVHDDALSSSEGLDEIVFEEGVQSIGEEALFDCEALKKITVAKSVTEIGEKALGYGYDSSYNEGVVSDVTIVTKKGSTADAYAKSEGIKVQYN